jgi:transcriptional regulator with XRE-family HTH domain
LTVVKKRVVSPGERALTSQEAKKVIPAALKKALAERGWSQYRLAQVTGISQMTISNIVNGVHDPKASNLKTIADALEMSLDDLVSTSSQKKGKSPMKIA